jgi:hypothetical protein
VKYPSSGRTEEDRARTVPATQAVFLAEVCECTRDDCVPTCIAHSRFIDQAVHVAIARTGAAVFQFGKHGFDALRKFSLPVRFQVCRLELPK